MGFFGKSVAAGVLSGAGRLRFPGLFVLAAVLFVIDLFVPDLVPFLDEILLGVATLLFASWRERRTDKAPEQREEGQVDVLPPEERP